MAISKKVAAILWGRSDKRCLGGGDARSVHRIQNGGSPVNPSSNGEGCKRGGPQAGGGGPQKETNGLAPHSEVVRPAQTDSDAIKLYPNGAKRGAVRERFDLIPPLGLQAVAEAMAKGSARYGDDNWRGLPKEEMVNHAIRHLVLWMAGDRSEPHAAHAAANCLMLVDLEGSSNE